MTRKLILSALGAAVVAAPSAALAHPVSQTQAVRAIQSGGLFPGSKKIAPCYTNRYGDLCLVSVSMPYNDSVFGPSLLVGVTKVWVSENNGQVTATPIGETFSIYTGGLTP